MFKKLRDLTRRQVENLVLALLGLAVLASTWGTLVRVHESMLEGREEVRLAGKRIADTLDHELDFHLSYLNAIDYLASQMLSGKLGKPDNPVRHLIPVPAQDGYASDFPPAYGAPQAIGRITGSGPIPRPDSPIAEEMAMAIGLTPLMRAIKERYTDVPWVQYASARGFMYIFPLAGAENFHFHADLLKRDYFARALPAVNPARAIFWSGPYEDAAGQGRILTLSKPIYRSEVFLGSVSIDFKVNRLRRFLDAVPVPKTHVHVLNAADRSRIVQAWSHEADDSGTQPHERIELTLKNAPWILELDVNEGELLKAAVRGRIWHIASLCVLVVTFIFLLLLTRSNRMVHLLSITDGLTGLYNRRHFDIVVSEQFQLARRGHVVLGLALLDIDFFKKYNDQYGHQQGDEALKTVARALRKTLRRGCDQVFRVGGEEFALLLCLSDISELQRIMAAVNQAVRDLKIVHVANPGGFATVSIGAVVISQGNWMPVDGAYRAADTALYEAKTQGRDRSVVHAPAPAAPEPERSLPAAG